MHHISLIIPAFNEEKRLPPVLASIQCWMESASSWASLEEIIIVDDGSLDRTRKIGDAFPSLPLRIVSFPVNRGKGAAIKAGIQEVTSQWILLFDADGATPIDELKKLVDRQQLSQAPIIIGSRLIDTSVSVTMQWHRRMIGGIYHFLTRPLIPDICDASCGFKLIQTDIARSIFRDVRTDGYGYDVEFLALVHRKRIPVEEVQVQWTAVQRSKVNVVTDGLRMFLSACALYFRLLFSGK